MTEAPRNPEQPDVPSERPLEATGDTVAFAEKGDSLWLDAWRRLRRNRMAMAGLVVVVFMGLTALLAGTISPFDPVVQERWIGAVPPGTHHLDLRNELTVQSGTRPERSHVPAGAWDAIVSGDSHRLVFTVWESEVTQLRLVVGRSGKIDRIDAQPPGGGIQWPQRVVLAEREFLRTKDSGERLAVRELAVGGPPPAPVTPGKRSVQVLEQVSRAQGGPYPVDCAIAGGKVARVTVGTQARSDPVAVDPATVQDVTLDGRRLEHTHVLGSDLLGRDTLSRVIYGGRISLLVGLVATVVSLLIGVIYGAASGFFGGRVDAILMRIVDVLYALPYLFLVILLLVAFGRDIIILFIALGAVQWLTIARIVRGQVLSLKEKEFVDAARTVGTGPWAILFRHIIPNTAGVVVVYTTLTVPAVILQESFLAFIGLTVEYQGQALESWGALVDGGRQALNQASGDRWWLLVFPALAMSITLFSMNFLGDGLRDALDPQMRGRG